MDPIINKGILNVPPSGSSNYIQTRNGIVIDSSEDMWEYSDKVVDVKLNFSSLPVTEEIRKSIKSTFIWYAENKSPDYLRNIFTYLSYFLVYVRDSIKMPVSEISCAMLIGYRSTLTKEREYLLGYITGFLKKWYDFNYQGITKEAIQYIESTTLAGNPKGEAVRTLDPTKGPFSEIEFQGINSKLRTAFKKGDVALQDFLLIWLFIAKGHRSIQYASLRVVDFISTKNDNGDVTYILNVPRAKQRDKFTRDSFKANKIIPSIGVLFEEHISKLIPIAENLGVLGNDMPLFPRARPRLKAPEGYAWHHTGNSLNTRIKYILNSLQLNSERTDAPLLINSQRFRYTLGSRMAAEGHPRVVIAEMLDHSTAEHVSVYTDNNPLIIKHIDKAMALALAPLAQVFSGEIAAAEAEIALGRDSNLVSDPRFCLDSKPMGNCSQALLCGALAPLECYLCINFCAWQNGPHRAVLDFLLKERERLAESDLRIAANYDRLILAVADVVNRCEQLQVGSGVCSYG